MLNSYKPKVWKEKKEALETALKDAGYPLGKNTKPVRYNDGFDLALEGGKMCVVYKVASRELYAWSRGSRYSGAEVSIKSLVEVRAIFHAWHDEHIKL
jgi:hypothetical protein